MPRTVTHEVYKFAELSDKAKGKARDWYREGGLDYDWWDCIYSDFDMIAGILGFEVKDKQFSGFWSQGDGACFTGRYTYAKGACANIRAHAPLDRDLHAIADALYSVQRKAFYQLGATLTKSSHHYSHANTVSVEAWRNDDKEVADHQQDAIREATRDLMGWLYASLEKEYEYLNSDESVTDSIEANEYEFNENGSRARL